MGDATPDDLVSFLFVKVPHAMNKKIARFLSENAPATPCLVVDLDVIAKAYDMLRRYLPIASVYYAVKANPAAEIVEMLAKKGSNFDVASPAEIALCLDNGATAERLSFGNTIKKERDIAAAYAAGVRLFAFDSDAELGKLARVAPGARVFCRILVSCAGADWSLSRKFGCTPDMAVALLRRARDLGLDPTACRSTSVRNRPISTSGTARWPRPRACSRCWPRPTSTCAWSISAAGFPRAIAARCRRCRPMPAR